MKPPVVVIGRHCNRNQYGIAVRFKKFPSVAKTAQSSEREAGRCARRVLPSANEVTPGTGSGMFTSQRAASAAKHHRCVLASIASWWAKPDKRQSSSADSTPCPPRLADEHGDSCHLARLEWLCGLPTPSRGTAARRGRKPYRGQEHLHVARRSPCPGCHHLRSGARNTS